MFQIKRTLIQCKQLPSGFGFYPKGAEVRFYPMTTKEVEHLNESDISSLMLFENALANISTTNMNKEDLTFSDFVYVSLQRRLYSQTEIRCTHKTYCPNCGTEIVEDFDFSEIAFDEPKDARNQRCTLLDYEVEIGPLTIGNMLEMLRSDNGVNVIDTLAHTVKKIYVQGSDVITVPDTELFETAKKIIEATWGEEREALNYIDSLQAHDMTPRKMKCTNKTCSFEWSEDLGSPSTLIFPSSGFRQSIASKVHPV